MKDEVIDDEMYEDLAALMRKAIAYELMLWARTYDETEAYDAIIACAHKVARGTQPPTTPAAIAGT